MRNIFYASLICFSLLARIGGAQSQPAGPLRRLAAPPKEEASLEFIANKGQWPAEVRYATAVPGGHLYLEAGGLRYVLLQPVRHPHALATDAPAAQPTARPRPAPVGEGSIGGHQVRVRFVGANATTPLTPTQPTSVWPSTYTPPSAPSCTKKAWS